MKIYSKKLCRNRLPTKLVQVGSVSIGKNAPLCIQSMVTTDTMDTQSTIDQCIRLANHGCQLIRITAPSPAAANNLDNIQRGLRTRGVQTPLVADIHFMPKAAEIAARIVSKVRINPGNYSDRKLFKAMIYTPETYQKELDRIYKSVAPLIKICQQEGTVLRIGCNHGSLSDRILSQYGDTPLGMVESALEFVRICEDLGFTNLVLSMKASNPKVMVAAYKLLVAQLIERNGPLYPLHLGVTEAGSNQDGRIKSAAGIGSLLQEGIGDTIRISLTEDPENEIPVAAKIIRLFSLTPIQTTSQIEPSSTEGHLKRSVHCFGGLQVPKIIVQHAQETDFDQEKPDLLWNEDRWTLTQSLQEEHPLLRPLPLITLSYLQTHSLNVDTNNPFGVILNHLQFIQHYELFNNLQVVCFLECTLLDDLHKNLFQLNEFCTKNDVDIPIIVNYPHILQGSTDDDKETYSVELSTHLGTACLQRWICGIVLSTGTSWEVQQVLSLYQASRLRISKPDYISCPSCGRTQFDLQTVTQRIQNRTSHLKGVKIGIMGCIVNGPGEMADADFGYVGSGKGEISLYRGQNVVAKNLPEDMAVDQLIHLIKQCGMWVDP